jgi:putative oxidoreductase
MGKIFSSETGALFLRLVVGLTFFYHGGQKMFGWFPTPGHPGGWDSTIQGLMGMAVAGHHLPEWLAMAVPITEFVGACCILVGLLTRFWAAGLAINMIMAVVLVHGSKAFARPVDINTVFGQLTIPATLWAMSMALFLGGPGKWYLADIEGWALGVKGGGGGGKSKAKKVEKE